VKQLAVIIERGQRVGTLLDRNVRAEIHAHEELAALQVHVRLLAVDHAEEPSLLQKSCHAVQELGI
jgi:hypothetical protein